MGAVCAALEQAGLPSGISLEAVSAINEYWEQVRLMYSCFDAGLKSGDSSVYEHEMPGERPNPIRDSSAVQNSLRRPADKVYGFYYYQAASIRTSSSRHIPWDLDPNGMVCKG